MVAVPQLLALDDSKESPLDDTSHHDSFREVDNQNHGRQRPKDVANMDVVAVHDPAGLFDELHNATSKLLDLQWRPVALMVDSVELETVDAHGLGERCGQR